jgi:YD repeat-containing protein
MGRAEPDRRRATPVPAAVRTAAYVDAEGRPTDDPEAAVRGEIVEYDAHGRLRRRTRFFLAEREIPWLPVSEPAFLLWVLAALMVIWLAIGLVLGLT